MSMESSSSETAWEGPQVFAVPPEHLSIWCGDDIRSRFRANVINHGWFPMFTALEHHFVPLVEV